MNKPRTHLKLGESKGGKYMLEIVKAPNPVLSQNAKTVQKIDKLIQKLIGEMTESLKNATDPIGVGLAAPQVGKPLQIFIAKPTLKSPVLVFINPKILKRENPIKYIPSPTNNDKKPIDKESSKKLEGCLSLPDIWGEVERYHTVIVSYMDEKGTVHKRKFDGFLAIIIQHEMDHLKGVLFPKRVIEQHGTLYKSEKDEKGEDVFEEIKI